MLKSGNSMSNLFKKKSSRGGSASDAAAAPSPKDSKTTTTTAKVVETSPPAQKQDKAAITTTTTTGPAKVAIDPKRPTKKLESLQALRYITALQMVGYHYFQNTPYPLFNRANAWGNAPFTFILMLSGFVMAYGYGRSNKPIDVSEFLIKRWANLYPLYIFSVLAGYLLIPSQNPQPLGLLVIMLLGLSGFVPSAFINDINTPGWTIGSLFILYAIFPFAVRMFKACSSKVKIFVVMPLLFTCSIGKPLADLSVNLGVLSGMARIAALASVPDFLQGINLGLLFLEHDWSKHPLIFQKFGLSASLAAACALFVMVDLQDLPIFCQLWRPYGMLQFLWMPVVWYAAHGKDVISYIFELPFITYLGNTSFGVYILQQLLIDYKWKNDPFLLANKYPQILNFALILTALGAIGYHCIQLPYQPYIAKEGNALLKKYRSSKASTYVNKALKLMLESAVGRGVTSLLFMAAYFAYVNWQPCMPVDFNHKLGTTKWFTMNDVNWLINWYATPCTPRRFLPYAISYYVELLAIAFAGVGMLGYGFSSVRAALGGAKSKYVSKNKEGVSVATPLMDLSDAAVVLRVVCKPRSDPLAINSTLDGLLLTAAALKAEERTVSLEVLGATESFTYTPPSTSTVDVTLLNMPFEAARTRSQIQPKDLVVTLPVGARLTPDALKSLLIQASNKAVVAFPLSVDGTEAALPSLGTLAELNFIAPARRPCVLVGSAGLQQKLPSTTTFAALEHGTHESEFLRHAQKGLTPRGCVIATPSLGAYLSRRLSYVKRATVCYSQGEKSGEAFRAFCESAFHFGFFLALVVVIGTPVHLFYSPGNYCNFYWSNQCTNGEVMGLSLNRVVMTFICAVYSAGYFAHFLSAFRPSEGGFVRQTILTFCMLFFLPFTSVCESVNGVVSALTMLSPARVKVTKDVPFTSPSAVA